MKRKDFIFLFLSFWLLFILIAALVARHSALNTLEVQLGIQMQQLSASRENLGNSSERRSLLAEQLSNDLNAIQVRGYLPLISQCRARVFSINNERFGEISAGEHELAITWQTGQRKDELNVAASCQLSWPWLVFSQGGLALLLIVTLMLGFGLRDQHRGLVLLRWFQRRKFGTASVSGVLDLAREAPSLQLSPEERTLSCRGIPVKLASTPFFYYMWYAKRRLEGINDGWYANPSADKSDEASAAELIALMESYGGHGKAIMDLKEKGLRARKLDQNRSKVREDIVRTLGEALADDFLFEVRRDPRTARYSYRLALPPERIRILESEKVAEGSGS